MPKREWSDVPEGALKLSATTLSSLELSPCRVTMKAEDQIPSEAMAFGTAVHAGLEQVLSGTLTWVKAQSAGHIREYVAEALEQDGFDLDHYLNGYDLDWYAEIGDAVAAFHPTWRTIETAGWNVAEVEQPRSRPRTTTKGTEYYVVTGGIDLIAQDTGGNTLGIDFKTAKRGWWKGDDGAARSQHSVYAWLAEEDFGLIRDWTYLVYDRSRQTWAPYHVQTSETLIASILTRLDGWADYLALDPAVRPHLCTPTDGKKRGWWSKPDYNPVWDTCPTCHTVGDEFDGKPGPDPTRPWFS